MSTIDDRIMEEFFEQLKESPEVSSSLVEKLTIELAKLTTPKPDELAQLIINESGESLA